MKILFFYIGRYEVRGPLELEYLSAIAAAAGHTVSLVYDPDLFGISDNILQNRMLSRLLARKNRCAREIISARPDLIVCSVDLSSYARTAVLAGRIKEILPVPVVFIGLQASLVPEHILNTTLVDYVIQGESEAVFPDFLEMIQGRLRPEEVGNLWYRRDGKVLATGRASLLDPDRLPLPDKELFGIFSGSSISYMMSAGRGCRYACSYCEETALGRISPRGFYRRRSVPSVIAELKVMQERYGFGEVIFKDAFFTDDIAWLRQFDESYRRAINLPFKCFGKVQNLTRETAQLLKDAGCYCLEFGMQTWNEDLRKRKLNRPETNVQALAVFRICDEVGLRYDIDHMFGIPGESESDHIAAVRLYGGMRCLNRVKCHNLVYLPGMPILECALEAGLVNRLYAEGLAEGAAADFFHTSRESAGMKRSNAVFRVFFKVMPVLPAGLMRIILAGKLYDGFRYLPGIGIKLIQLIGGLKNRDLRFRVYLKQYPRKIIRALTG